MIMRTLTGQATELRVREDSQNIVETYLILAAGPPSLRESQNLTDRLQAVGYKDFHLYMNGPHQHRVSLGTYRNKRYAEEKRGELADLGVGTELVAQHRERPSYWLDVQLLPQITAIDLAAASRILGKSGLAASACGIVAEREKPAPTLARASAQP